MSASDHLGSQFPKMPIEDVLKLPSIDALAYGVGHTVGDVLPMKKREMESGWEKDVYDDHRRRFAEHGQETPVHIFPANRQAYSVPIPKRLRGQQMMGNGHHRVIMAMEAGHTDIAYTPYKQKSATEEDL